MDGKALAEALEVAAMKWTEEDKSALAACREAKIAADSYSIPAPPIYSAYERLLKAAMEAGIIEGDVGIETGRFVAERPAAGDLCDGCGECVNGGCRRGYQTAVLDADRKKVVKCLLRRERR